MAAESDASGDDRLASALERLASIQKSILELNVEANQIRRHVKDFDFNVDALNLLAIARSRDERSGGGNVLADVVRYARQTGVQVDATGSEDVSPVSEEEREREPRSLALEENAEPERERGLGVLKLVSQLVVAAAVTTGLFVLIH